MTKIFIAWSGENKLIAEKLSVLLHNYGFTPVVGGENATTMMINNQVIKHMDDSEMAVLIIEENTSRNSTGVSGNIMFEWGYLLHKLNDPSKIQAFLINMSSSNLPSDVAGCFVGELTKKVCSNPDEKNAEFDRLASEIFQSVVSHIEKHKYRKDKLSYIDNWEEEKHRILNFNNNDNISELLLFGMQATIYSGGYQRLFEKLQRIQENCEGINPEVLQVIRLCTCILDVFVTTKRLTQPLCDNDFDRLYDSLSIEYESKIKDENLAAWCHVLRIDKIELCLELYAASQQNEEFKMACCQRALETCKTVLQLLNKLVEENPFDQKYALLYLSFANRNLSLIYNELNELSPSEEYPELIKKHCNEAMLNRKELYEHYFSERNKTSVAMDYITQEYILALAEQARFEQDEFKLLDIRRKIKKVYTEWSEKNSIRNMIFDKITEVINKGNLI